MLEDLGNIGDFLGGIGVVVTLVYLAYQIRQNTDQIRQNTSTVRASGAASQYAGMTSGAMLVAQDPDSRSVYRRGLEDYRGLTEDEKFHFQMVATVSLNPIQMALHLGREDALSQEASDEAIATVDYLLAYPGFLDWWSEVGQAYPAPFRRFMGERISHCHPPAQQSAAADSVCEE
jgi:hypothetical protein